MSLISNVPLSNVTTFRRDYKKKPLKRREVFVPLRDYKDPLAGPHTEYLLPYRKYNASAKPNEFPDPKEYCEEVCERRSALRRYLKNPDGPNFDLIDHLYDNDGRSTYMISYCRLGDYESSKSRGRAAGALPKDWVIPATTQLVSYRHPDIIAPGGLTRVKPKALVDNLKPNEKERAILDVKTGESDYMATIGRTGQEIIDGKLHGDVEVRPQFSQDELLRAMLIRRD